ncbi:hypothetical protein [Paracoccus jeotgali]|uniref:hypothetical protein n=1 Tax=Paracoccus jeotgali TaxID=2065379 RepID=UPI0013155A7C|nr:hypothetical protein [Paracoccus jeotgali]
MKKTNPLLAAMKTAEPETDHNEAPSDSASPGRPGAKAASTRAGQKHLGAYFDKGDQILERVAILRMRLDMNNSELIEHAINELWKRHEASRVFGE